MSKTRYNILAFLSGAAIGAGIGLLYAPEKGEKTRKIISDEEEKTKDKVKTQWDKTSANLSESAKKTLSEMESKLDHTLSVASDRAEDLLTSLQKRLDELREQTKNMQDKS